MSVSIFEYDEEKEMELIRKAEREAGMEAGIEVGMARGLARGIAVGREEGADDFAALTAKLLADSRTEDLIRATTDKEFRDILYLEYGISKS